MEWNILFALILNSLTFFVLGRMSNYKKFKHQEETRNINENEQKEKVCKGDKVMGYYLVSEEKRKELFNIK